MKWYFDSIRARKKLIAACEFREGTPFREGMSKPKAGYDCAHFVRDCFKEAGIDTSRFDACPRISLNAGRLSSTSLLIEWLHNIGLSALTRFDGDQPVMCGDILCIKERLSCIHIALAVSDEWAWHVPANGSVCRIPVSRFRMKDSNYIQSFYRLKKDFDV
jgi:hypothetical protein